MKRFIAFVLAFVGLFLFAACNTVTASDTVIECADVIAAYEEAGYEIFHKDASAEDFEWVCCVKATDADTQNSIYFYFFETHKAAVAYSETRQYNSLIWLFSVIYGNPSWMTTKVHNEIEIEYDDGDLYKPFKSLLEEKE